MARVRGKDAIGFGEPGGGEYDTGCCRIVEIRGWRGQAGCLVVVPQKHRASEFPNRTHTGLHARSVAHDVAQADDLRNLLRPDIVKNSHQRLKI